MTDHRPDADALRGVMLDDRHRRTPSARQHQIADVRCPRGHLLAVAVGTRHGPWVAWRQPWVQRTPTGGWEVEWSDQAGVQQVQCTCRDSTATLDLEKLADQRGTVPVGDAPRPPVLDADTTDDAARLLP